MASALGVSLTFVGVEIEIAGLSAGIASAVSAAATANGIGTAA